MNSINPYILIPAYQPNSNLLLLVDELLANSLSNIIVVNDGSTSEHLPIFAKLPEEVIVLKHDANYGKGAALKTGFEYLKEHSLSASVITADADGQHIVTDIKKIYTAVQDNSSALILGVRQFNQQIPWRSRFGNELTKKIFLWFCHYPLEDTQTGLRGIPSFLQEKFSEISSNRYEFESECLMLAIYDKVEIIQIPINTIYIDNNQSSHFNPFWDSIRIYVSFFKRYLSILFKKK